MTFSKFPQSVQLLVLFSLISIVCAQNLKQDNTNYPTFKQYKEIYGKKYLSWNEYHQRQTIYLQNIEQFTQISCTNCKINFQTDLNIIEIQTIIKDNKQKNSKINPKFTRQTQKIDFYQEIRNKRLLTQSIPTSYDWRNHTNFTTVKNSGICGSSQAFATAAFFQQEIITAGISNQSIDLSEMYLMGCNPQNSGCNPGLVEPLLDLVLQKGGIPLESQYPFNPPSVPQKICFQQSLFSIPNVSRVSYYEVKDLEKIKQIIFKKPAIASVCGVDMVSYSHDPTNSSSRTLRCSPHNRVKDHHVLLVGYTETEWIVKNSWGPGWGIEGYGYISKDNAEDCCIGDEIHTTGIKEAVCSVQYCDVCVEKNSCSVCQAGRYVFVNFTTGVQTCELCTYLNCQQCYNYLGTCKWCATDNSYDQATNECIDSLIINCNRIQDGFCSQCKPGYKLSQYGDSCDKHCPIENCNGCPYGRCTVCIPGFHLMSTVINGTQSQFCRLNSCSVQNCSLCNPTGECVKCKNGFLLNSTSSQCYSNCQLPNCISCSADSAVCDVCIDGKSWNHYSKVCQTFTSPNCQQHGYGCYTCKQGYKLNLQTSQCEKICLNSNCLECLISDITYCLACQPGYTLSTTEYFSICQKNTCTVTNCQLCYVNSLQCIKCNGFLVYNSTGNQCQNQCTLQNCQGCFPGDYVCSKCNEGYAINSDDLTCVQLNITNCVTVYYAGDPEQSCSQCKQKYYVIQTDQSFDKQCALQCQDYNCLVCNIETPYICQQCNIWTDFKLVDGIYKCQFLTSSIKNCDVPSINQTYCVRCSEYYARNQQTGFCQLYTNCPIECEYCTAPPPEYQGPVSCKCKDGLFYQSISQKCITNPFNDTNCIQGRVSQYFSFCGKCVQGMFVNFTTWKSCVSGCHVQNCLNCLHGSYMVCQICIQGYYPSISGTSCIQCLETIANCMTCFKYKCIQCKYGYRLSPNGLTCDLIQCTQKQIFNGQNCVCPLSTYYVNSTCDYCSQSNCISCNENNCFQCKEGFYLTLNQCKICQVNCKLCSSVNTCLQCQEGYFYDLLLQQCINIHQISTTYNNTQTSIIPCPFNCLTCTLDSKCVQCFPDYNLIAGKCYQCINNCKTCYPGNLELCKSCHPGFTLDKNNACTKCNVTNCRKCPFSSLSCSLCNPGFYLENGTSCKICQIDNCEQCNYFGKCIQCSSGFTLMSDGTCQQCGGNCRSCNSSAINQCFTECNSTSFLLNNACISCPSECKTCASASVCLSCASGLSLREGKCLKPCQVGCYECNQSNTSICLICLYFYILQSNGTCNLEVSCNNNNSCSFCPSNWVLNNGQCQVCEINAYCKQCSVNNVSYCDVCKDKYYQQNGTCLPCSENCLNCYESSSCEICLDGYLKVIGGNCLKCSSMCKTCTELTQKCTSCNDGYELTVTDKCLRKTKISGQIILNIALSNFPSVSKDIKRSIITCLGQSYQNDTKYYIITNLQSGSTILTFTVSLPDGLDQATTYTTFKTNAAALTQINGISVISVSQVSLLNTNVNFNINPAVFNDETVITNPPSTITQTQKSTSTKNLAIILGIVIPSIFIIFVIVGWVIRKNFYAKKVQNDQQFQIKELPDHSMVQKNPKFGHTIDYIFDQTPIRKVTQLELSHLDTLKIPQQSHQRLNYENESSSKVQIEQEIEQSFPENRNQREQTENHVSQFVVQKSNDQSENIQPQITPQESRGNSELQSKNINQQFRQKSKVQIEAIQDF